MTVRDGSGRFLPGGSGNPNGARRLTAADKRAKERRRRAEAARSAAQQKVQQEFQAAIARVSAATIASALEGDAAAQRLVLERVDPPQRPQTPPIAIPGFDRDVSTASNAVMSLLAEGRISVEKGQALLAILEKKAQLEFAQGVVFEMHRLRENLKRHGLTQLVPGLTLEDAG